MCLEGKNIDLTNLFYGQKVYNSTFLCYSSILVTFFNSKAQMETIDLLDLLAFAYMSKKLAH